MVFGYWLSENWFTLLETGSIVGSLLFTAFSMRADTKTRRITNALAITQNHREIWAEVFDKPELSRVLDVTVDLDEMPLRREEQIFVNFVILHLNSVFDAMKHKLIIKPEGLHRDVGRFFTLPIPRAVWKKMKSLHEDDFIEFVENCWK